VSPKVPFPHLGPGDGGVIFNEGVLGDASSIVEHPGALEVGGGVGVEDGGEEGCEEHGGGK